MKQLLIRLSILTVVLQVIFSSCIKKANPTLVVNTTVGAMMVKVTGTAGSELLVLNNKTYVTGNQDSITISRFNYYISNVVLNNTSGKHYVENNSYHLVKMDDPTSYNFKLDSIPTGTYSSITFLIGVDSLHNVDGANTGIIDPIHGMFWDWNSGYIMAKMEGTSPESSAADHSFTYHIGGYSGQDNGLRTVTLTFQQPLVITTGNTAHSYWHADALKWFSGAHLIDISVYYSIMNVSGNSSMVADNYAHMFGVDSTFNK